MSSIGCIHVEAESLSRRLIYISFTLSWPLLYWMLKADRSWPRPQDVAWQSPYLNCFSMQPKPSLPGLPAYLNSSTCMFPSTELIIFDHSDNKTRLCYAPVFPLVRSPTVNATKFSQSYDVNGEGQARSENQEATEEINALLYSDNDNDEDNDDNCYEVTSAGRSPLETKRTYMMQEQFEDMKEEVASCDWPNKRLMLMDGGYNRSSLPVDNASLVKLNETCECASDAESKNSSDWVYSVDKTKVDSSMVGDTKMKRDEIRKSLRVLENLIPGTKGKVPLLVIDGTIEYLKFFMSQNGTLGVKYDQVYSLSLAL
ncbi:transcription factor SAC51-like [Gastrolobium bilobum]|uniref:transcription factor SAC51-like n=1 Tax=Gastrolobium bilobum TaxID=150636 RepID=UPI002AB2329C|nr:transcription factor SAC51-like [Gastrolobium bilobum]